MSRTEDKEARVLSKRAKLFQPIVLPLGVRCDTELLLNLPRRVAIQMRQAQVAGDKKGDRAAGGAMHAETVDTHLFSDATDLMLADQRFQLASEFVCNFRRYTKRADTLAAMIDSG